MSSDHDEFATFVAGVLPEIRHIARVEVGSHEAAERVLRAALAQLAQHWRLAAADDPRRFLVSAIESRARDQGDEAADEPLTPASTVELAAEAWAAGQYRRGRGRRRTVAVGAAIILLVGGYVWTTRADTGPDPQEQSASHATRLADTVYLLPPPSLMRQAPYTSSALPGDDDDLTVAAPALTERHADRFTAAFEFANGSPGVLSADRLPRSLHGVQEDFDKPELFPRAVAPDGEHVAFATSKELIVVDREGDITRVDLPDGFAEPIDVAWDPDGERLSVASRDATFSVTADGEKRRDHRWYGPAAIQVAADRVLEFIATGDRVAGVTWKDGEPGTSRALDLPVTRWGGVPIGEPGGEVIARACEPDTASAAPSYQDEAVACVAALGPSGKRLGVLLIPADYAGLEDCEVLSVVDGRVFFTVKPEGGGQKLLLSWQVESSKLGIVSTLVENRVLALGQV